VQPPPPGDADPAGTGPRTYPEVVDGPAPPPSGECLAVSLIPQVSADLRRAGERTGLSRADIVNRAVSWYEFTEGELRSGSQLIVRRASGEEYVVRLL